jgi:multidrug resistance protein
MFENRSLMILVLVMLVNSLSYGTIIPLLYPYTSRFGVNPLILSLIFASFSLAQLIATPIIGRLSDQYGRKPLLLWCLFGTGISQILMALANSIPMIFIARILDGVTGGNNSVAQAMVADTVKGADRAKAFGLLGAAMGAGFLIGPAIGGLLSGISLTAPFWFSAVLAIAGSMLGFAILPESLPSKSEQAAKQEPMFRLQPLIEAITSPGVGVILSISFLATLALNTFILGFQTYTVDVLRLTPTQVGVLFALFGTISVVMQAGGISLLLKYIKDPRKILFGSLAISTIVLLFLSTTEVLWTFTAVLIVHMFASAPQFPMVAAMVSNRARDEDQGGLLGINQAYVSMGQIVGPIVGGVVASRFSVSAVFVVAGLLYGVSALSSRFLFVPPKHKEDI